MLLIEIAPQVNVDRNPELIYRRGMVELIRFQQLGEGKKIF